MFQVILILSFIVFTIRPCKLSNPIHAAVLPHSFVDFFGIFPVERTLPILDIILPWSCVVRSICEFKSSMAVLHTVNFLSTVNWFIFLCFDYFTRYKLIVFPLSNLFVKSICFQLSSFATKFTVYNVTFVDIAIRIKEPTLPCLFVRLPISDVNRTVIILHNSKPFFLILFI